MENQEKDLKRFVIEYEDGTVREVKKGFLCTMEPGEDDDVTFTYDMLGISGGELKLLVGGMLQLGHEAGNVRARGGRGMSKKRFVEFYLSAMLKAATSGRVTRVAYLYYDLTHTEVVRVEYEHDHGGGVNELPVTGLSLLGIAAAVIDRLKGWPLE